MNVYDYNIIMSLTKSIILKATTSNSLYIVQKTPWTTIIHNTTIVLKK